MAGKLDEVLKNGRSFEQNSEDLTWAVHKLTEQIRKTS